MCPWLAYVSPYLWLLDSSCMHWFFLTLSCSLSFAMLSWHSHPLLPLLCSSRQQTGVYAEFTHFFSWEDAKVTYLFSRAIYNRDHNLWKLRFMQNSIGCFVVLYWNGTSVTAYSAAMEIMCACNCPGGQKHNIHLTCGAKTATQLLSFEPLTYIMPLHLRHNHQAEAISCNCLAMFIYEGLRSTHH